jgi:hypothetical protein
MTHYWKPGGSHGQWVLHSSAGKAGDASDSAGVGLGEDVLGPFSTRRTGGKTLAETVADALNNAYAAGRLDITSERAAIRDKHRKRPPVNGPDPYDPTADDGTTAHDSLDLPSYGS